MLQSFVPKLAQDIVAQAEGGTDLQTFITSITGGLGDFTPANLAIILLAGLGMTVGLTLSWFAFRWIIRKVTAALKKGRLS